MHVYSVLKSIQVHWSVTKLRYIHAAMTLLCVKLLQLFNIVLRNAPLSTQLVEALNTRSESECGLVHTKIHMPALRRHDLCYTIGHTIAAIRSGSPFDILKWIIELVPGGIECWRLFKPKEARLAAWCHRPRRGSASGNWWRSVHWSGRRRCIKDQRWRAGHARSFACGMTKRIWWRWQGRLRR